MNQANEATNLIRESISKIIAQKTNTSIESSALYLAEEKLTEILARLEKCTKDDTLFFSEYDIEMQTTLNNLFTKDPIKNNPNEFAVYFFGK